MLQNGKVDSSPQVVDVSVILTGIVRSLLAPDATVQVEIAEDADSTLFTLRVDEANLAALMGSGGRTVRSLRTVLTALGKRSGKRMVLDVQANSN